MRGTSAEIRAIESLPEYVRHVFTDLMVGRDIDREQEALILAAYCEAIEPEQIRYVWTFVNAWLCRAEWEGKHGRSAISR